MTFWRNANFGPSWQAAARRLANSNELGLAETARLFALLNMGLANNYIVNWDAKYTYNFWRPVTAIRNGEMDGNDATERDPGWTPMNVTPLHPEYPSQATINATVSSAISESVFGPATTAPFTVTDIADPKRTRQFKNIPEWWRSKRMSASGAVSISGPQYSSARTWAARSRRTCSRTRSSRHVDVSGRRSAKPRFARESGLSPMSAMAQSMAR